MKFTSEAHSLIFYTAESGTEDPVFFRAHEAEVEDKDQIAALKSDRALAAGVSYDGAAEPEPEPEPEPESEPEPEPQPEPQPEPEDYSTLKQPELKTLLTARGIEFPTGVVSNKKLIELLSAPETPAE